MRSRYHPILISFGKVGFFVTVQVDRCPERNALGVLKLFRLKEPFDALPRTLAKKQHIFASNMSSKCTIFPLFLTALSL